jgi:hypothetical protein
MAVHIILHRRQCLFSAIIKLPSDFAISGHSGTVSRLIFPHFVCVGAILKFLEDLCF